MSTKRVAVEYHPEFLYFNEFIRREGCTPDRNIEMWMGLSEPSPYDVLNMMLEQVSLSGKQVASMPHIAKRFADCKYLPGIKSSDVDVDSWVRFARSFAFEKMVERYSRVIFKHFGTTFGLPVVKVSPVRLGLFKMDLFQKILTGRYTYSHILQADSPYYDVRTHRIYLFIPERPAKIPPALYDLILIHEFLHAPLRMLYAEGFSCADVGVEPSMPSGWAFPPFGELFSNLGAITILKECSLLPKGGIGKLPQDVRRMVKVDDSFSGFVSYAMSRIGFTRLCEMLRPVFNLYKEAAFLSAERARLERFTEKQLEGILRKKYSYKKSVRGRSKKSLKKEVTKRMASRWRSMEKRIEAMDLRKLLRTAQARKENASVGAEFSVLLGAFSDEMKEAWRQVYPNYIE